MSPLRRTGRPPGGVAPALTRMVASALVLVTALLLVRASAVATTRDTASEVCVGPVPVGGSCTSTSSTTSSTRSTTQSTSTGSASTTGTQTETTATSTATASTDTTGGTTTSTSTASGPGAPPASSGTPSPAASRFPPPPPPLPPPSPGTAPVAPEQAVQRIVMVPAVSGPIAPGDTVEVQAILEAQRGTDIYAVPHVPVTFALVSVAGAGGAVSPTRVSSGDSGVAIARVRTGDRPGDTVVTATSGTASAQLTLHTDLAAAGAAARVTAPATSGGESGSGGRRAALVGALAALGILGALSLGLVRRRHPGGA